jgi:hypothetical protein
MAIDPVEADLRRELERIERQQAEDDKVEAKVAEIADDIVHAIYRAAQAHLSQVQAGLFTDQFLEGDDCASAQTRKRLERCLEEVLRNG